MKDMTRADIEKMVTDYYPGYESMLKKMDDDTLFEYIEKIIGEQIKEQYGIQMANMYSYLSDSTLAHDFGLLSLEDDDYLWLYENAMPPIYSTSTLGGLPTSTSSPDGILPLRVESTSLK